MISSIWSSKKFEFECNNFLRFLCRFFEWKNRFVLNFFGLNETLILRLGQNLLQLFAIILKFWNLSGLISIIGPKLSKRNRFSRAFLDTSNANSKLKRFLLLDCSKLSSYYFYDFNTYIYSSITLDLLFHISCYHYDSRIRLLYILLRMIINNNYCKYSQYRKYFKLCA